MAATYRFPVASSAASCAQPDGREGFPPHPPACYSPGGCGRASTRTVDHENTNANGRTSMTHLRSTLLGGCACCPPAVGLSRRGFVAGGAALAFAATAAPGVRAVAQSKAHRIDVHH